MDMRRLVGSNVRRLREKKGLTQEQFAEISGFSQQYISGLEQGHRRASPPAFCDATSAFLQEPLLDHVPDALRGIVAQAADLVPLFWHAQSFGEPPSEDELIAHLIVPFLRALGWPPERIAVKWRRIDVAVFLALPRTPENCRLVIGAKRLGAGVPGVHRDRKC
jgi:transcriptional regulator with XRE-family HTH domain